jgi:para-aminobenzoate synthetase component 1
VSAPLTHVVVRDYPWTDPLAVAAGIGGAEGGLVLLSDGGPGGRWSHVATAPDRVHVGAVEADLFSPLRDPAWGAGTVGLAAYDAGARPATGDRPQVWPDLILARYPAMLSFAHHQGRIRAVGRGRSPAEAAAAAARAADWLAAARPPVSPEAPAEAFTPEADDQAYRDAVAQVVARIGAGELFQANIARAWGGALKPEADPFDVFLRLQQGRASPYGAFWRIGDRALVSNSPELFLAFDGGTRRIEARPIKGTRARSTDPVQDAALAAELQASAKDRAENLMIVDLMRNDLARASRIGSVEVERLFAIESHPTVHHLVSTVVGRAEPGVTPADLLAATFPPGSITGAPKHQAMKVIAELEPTRGAWCGSLFILEEDGGLTASVLIRTASFEHQEDRWTFRTLAGAGIVADSDPEAELAETEVKISALKRALVGQQSEQGMTVASRGFR